LMRDFTFCQDRAAHFFGTPSLTGSVVYEMGAMFWRSTRAATPLPETASEPRKPAMAGNSSVTNTAFWPPARTVNSVPATSAPLSSSSLKASRAGSLAGLKNATPVLKLSVTSTGSVNAFIKSDAGTPASLSKPPPGSSTAKIPKTPNASDEIVAAMKKVGHPNFRIWYDAGNIIYYTGKDPVEELKPIVQYVTGFCAKDCGELKGDVMIQFGAGKVDFKGVFKVLKAAGFQGPIMVEGCAPGDTPEAVTANARANREFLERVLTEL